MRLNFARRKTYAAFRLGWSFDEVLNRFENGLDLLALLFLTPAEFFQLPSEFFVRSQDLA
jgi:hypothetical protein